MAISSRKENKTVALYPNLRVYFIRTLNFAAACLAAIALSACSSIIEGTHQDVTVNTNPPGAACQLSRNGENVGTVANTPGTTSVRKTKDDLLVTCNKGGYQTATFIDKSGADIATVGNLVQGGGIGWAVDSATGSDNKYDSPINISTVPAAPQNAAK